MRSTLLFLFALLQTGFLFAQFDENYLGYYRLDNESVLCHIAKSDDLDFDFLDLTEEQKKNCAFVFAVVFEYGEVENFGYTMKKGNVYTSVANETNPPLTFAFKSGAEGEAKTVEITDKSGNKTVLTQFDPLINFNDGEFLGDGSDAYGDYDEYQPVPQEELMDIRGYSRSDGAELVITFAEESVTFSIHVPATKSCSEVIIEGKFDSPNLVNNTYTYTNTELAYTLEATATDSGWQLKCAKGECFDKKNKCGIWKEAFMLNN